jgi:hypothetical protein
VSSGSPIRAKEELPAASASKVLASDVQLIKDGLAKAPTTKGAIKGLKSLSMLLALNAQNQAGGADGAKMAGLRDVAMTIATALEKGKVADAAKLAGGFDSATGDPKKAVKLAEHAAFSLDEAMSTLGSSRAGGQNIETDFKDRSVATTLKDPKKVEAHAVHIALIGQYSVQLPPSDAVGAKKKKWDELSQEMTKLAVELAEEAGKAKADVDVMKKKISAVNKNCVDCHNEFRK